MLNLLHVSVVKQNQVDELLEKSNCTNVYDIDFDLVQDYDYAQTALIDNDKKHIIYWNDNMHSDPKLFVDSFFEALDYANVDYVCNEIVMLDTDLKDMSGQKY